MINKNVNNPKLSFVGGLQFLKLYRLFAQCIILLHYFKTFPSIPIYVSFYCTTVKLGYNELGYNEQNPVITNKISIN